MCEIKETNNKYDSTSDTVKHILRINELLHKVAKDVLDRADKHDRSKLSPEEKNIFDEFTPKLKNATFGSDEYKSFLTSMGDALKHHYENNKSHHPDLLTNGILDMNLLDLVEMLIDWKAASERHANGNILDSIMINKKRFNMSDDLVKIFLNTVDYFSFANPITFIIQAALSKDFYLLEDHIIKEIETKFDVKCYHNNCLPMVEETLEEFKANCIINGAHHCQYFFKSFRSLDSTKEVIEEIKMFLTEKSLNIYTNIFVTGI